ncbi:MAG: hypothetical protein M3067_15855 [Chloroflexota bacterium]|nr:hypothetical protein [Chloroflexota bacterium]
MTAPAATRLALAVLVATTLASGCNASPPSNAPATRSSSPSPAASSARSPSAVATEFGLIDPSLLDLLPPTVGGLPIQRNSESDAIVASNATVLAYANGAITGLAVDAAAGEFVHATVVRLRPGVFSDGFFRDWRDGFDGGVCAPVGGVRGHAEATIGGHQTFIGSCVEAVLTYHVWLPISGILVSVSSVGPRMLGQRLIEGLRD